jgi:nicotinamidase/pyrazinamidase
MSFETKYLKYKQKYLSIKEQIGGAIVSGLMIVDPQNDFCPPNETIDAPGWPKTQKGALAVTDANSIFPHINRLQDLFKGKTVFISQDWHPKTHVSFASNQGQDIYTKKDLVAKDAEGREYKFTQVLWPNHCVQETPGANFSALLNRTGQEIIIRKGQDSHNMVDSYSAFGDEYKGTFEKTELQKIISERGITRLVVVGLATDYCVGCTAMDAKLFFPTMEVILIENCMRGVAPDTTAAKIEAMKNQGIIVFKTVDEYLASKYII